MYSDSQRLPAVIGPHTTNNKCHIDIHKRGDIVCKEHLISVLSKCYAVFLEYMHMNLCLKFKCSLVRKYLFESNKELSNIRLYNLLILNYVYPCFAWLKMKCELKV